MHLFFLVSCLFNVSSVTLPHIKQYSSRWAARNLKNVLETMPKEMKHTVILQKQRQKLKEKSQKYVPGTVTIKVLGSGAKGAPRSLYVFTDQSRYLFNCGEGTQRLAHEHKMKLSKLEHIFITQPSWENIGGLPGVALTIQDVGVPEITIHGPAGTNEIFTATRRFVILRDLSVQMANCTAGGHFEDNVLTVQYVPIAAKTETKVQQCAPEQTESTSTAEDSSKEKVSDVHSPARMSGESEDDVDYYAHERKKKRRHSGDRDRKRVCREPVCSVSLWENPISMSYVCRLKARPGTLCLERCVERGVPPGPLLGKLKSGQDVVLDDGTMVRSADVCLPDDPGPIFIVVECPTVDYVDCLVNEPMFYQHQSTAKKDEDVAHLVVHFTPSVVMEDPRYRSWMEKFIPSTHHLVLNEENNCMGSVAVHRIQHKLHLLHPDMFPLLQDSGIAVEEPHASTGAEAMAEVSPNEEGILKEENGMNKEQSDIVVHERTCRLTNVNGVCNKHSRQGIFTSMSLVRGKTFYAIHLRPKKILDSESDCILLDCGEGTYGQLVRYYGPDEVDKILCKIQAIYVSHLHADHHIGLIGILKGRRLALNNAVAQNLVPQESLNRPIFLLAPKQIRPWLSLYHRIFEPILQEVELIPNGDLDLMLDGPTLSWSVKTRLLDTLNMVDIDTVLVKHCPNAFGVALKHRDGWKMTYSGDTMPCPHLVTLGQGSDLLIHEATMEDDLEGEARAKLHSTTSQAIQMGKDMGAKFTLLTHFSQRYAKLPRLNDNFTSNVGIAFDNMQVRLGELPLLPLLYPSLKLMFAEHYEELEQKAARRLMKQERERENQGIT